MSDFFNKNSTIFAVVTSVAAAMSVGYNIVQQNQINRLTVIKDVTKEKESLLNDSFTEVILSRMNELREQNIENARNQGRVEGMISVATNLAPDQNVASAFGHEWYYKGLSQAEFMEENAYVKGYHQATEDLNCPADVRDKAIDTAEKKFAKMRDEARGVDAEARKRIEESKQKIEEEKKKTQKDTTKKEATTPEAQPKK